MLRQHNNKLEAAEESAVEAKVDKENGERSKIIKRSGLLDVTNIKKVPFGRKSLLPMKEIKSSTNFPTTISTLSQLIMAIENGDELPEKEDNAVDVDNVNEENFSDDNFEKLILHFDEGELSCTDYEEFIANDFFEGAAEEEEEEEIDLPFKLKKL